MVVFFLNVPLMKGCVVIVNFDWRCFILSSKVLMLNRHELMECIRDVVKSELRELKLSKYLQPTLATLIGEDSAGDFHLVRTDTSGNIQVVT